MARVFALHYDRMHHRASGAIFEPVQVPNDEGRPVMRGLAIVSDEIAREHFARLPEAFRIEYADTPAADRTPTQAAVTLVPIVPPAAPATPAEPNEAESAKRGPGRPRTKTEPAA